MMKMEQYMIHFQYYQTDSRGTCTFIKTIKSIKEFVIYCVIIKLCMCIVPESYHGTSFNGFKSKFGQLHDGSLGAFLKPNFFPPR